MNLETLVLELVADDSKLSRDIDAAVASATKKLAEVERVGAINPSVDLKSLHELNKLLDVKQRHLKETVKYFNANPIKVKVDASGISKAKQEIAGLKGELSGMSATVKAEITHKFESQKDSSNQIVSAIKELTKVMTPKKQGVIGSAMKGLASNAMSIPLTIAKGALMGFGQDTIKQFSSGFGDELNKVITPYVGSLNTLGKRSAKDLERKTKNVITKTNAVYETILDGFSDFEAQLEIVDKINVTKDQRQELKAEIKKKRDIRPKIKQKFTEFANTQSRVEDILIQSAVDENESGARAKAIRKGKKSYYVDLADKANIAQSEYVSKQQEYLGKRSELKPVAVSVASKLKAIGNENNRIYAQIAKLKSEGDAWNEIPDLKKQIDENALSSVPLIKIRKSIIGALGSLAADVESYEQKAKDLSSKAAMYRKSLINDVVMEDNIKTVLQDLGVDIPDRMPSVVPVKSARADAAYNVMKNQISVSPEMYQRMQSPDFGKTKADQKGYRVLAHELTHAEDLEFGSDSGIASKAKGRTKGSDSDISIEQALTIQGQSSLHGFLKNYRNFPGYSGTQNIKLLEMYAESTARQASKSKFGAEEFNPLDVLSEKSDGLLSSSSEVAGIVQNNPLLAKYKSTITALIADVESFDGVISEIKDIGQIDYQKVDDSFVDTFNSKVLTTISSVSGVEKKLNNLIQEIESTMISTEKYSSDISGIESQLDDAFNLDDLQLLQDAKKRIAQTVKLLNQDDSLDEQSKKILTNQFKELQKKAKVDTLTVSVTAKDVMRNPMDAMSAQVEKSALQLADKGVELVHAFVDPLVETANNVMQLSSQVANDPTKTLKSAGSAIVRGGNAGIRGIAPAIGGAYSVASGIENAALSVLPYGHLAKKGIQVGAVTMGLPMAAASIPALAPVAGMLGAAGHLGGAAAGSLAAGQMAGISSIPIIGGQVAAMLGGAASGLGTIVAEMGAAAIAVNAVSVGTKALIGTALEPQTKEKIDQLKPAQDEIKRATAKKTSKLIEKAQNLDAYLPTLPESQRNLIGEYLPKAAGIERANQGDFIPQNVALPGLKALAPADYKKLDSTMQSAVESDFVMQYKAAQKVMFEFMAKMRGSIDPLDRMKGDIASLSSAFKAQVKRLEKQGKDLGFDVSKHKLDPSAFKGVTLDADAVEMPDISKMKRSATDTVKGFTEGAKQGEKQVEMVFVELAQSGQEGFDKTMKIESPSKWAIERMNFIALGLMKGGFANMPKVKNMGEMTAEEYAKGFKKSTMPELPLPVPQLTTQIKQKLAGDNKKVMPVIPLPVPQLTTELKQKLAQPIEKQFEQIADPWAETTAKKLAPFPMNKLVALPSLNVTQEDLTGFSDTVIRADSKRHFAKADITREAEANRWIDEEIKKTNGLTAAIERKRKAQERMAKLPPLPSIDAERNAHFAKFKTDPYVYLDNNQATGNKEIDALISRIREKGIVVDNAISEMVKEAQSSIDSAFDGVASTSNAESKKLIEQVTKTLSDVSVALDNYNFDDGKFIEGSQKALDQLVDIYSIGDSSSAVSLEDIQSIVKRLTQTLSSQPSTGNYLADMETQLNDLVEAYSIDPDVIAPDTKEINSILESLSQKEAELNKAMDLVDQREELVASGYSINDANRIIASADDGSGGSPPKIPPIFDLIREKVPFIGQAIDGFNELKNSIKNFGMLAVGGIGLALLAKGLFEVGKNALTAYQNLEGVFIASKLLAGSDKYIANLRKQALQLGSDLQSTLEQGIQFSSALVGTPLEAMSQQMFQDFSTALSYLGLQQQQYDSALLALKQVASKGRVSLEEITGQLGEAVPGIMPLVADALGTNVQGAIQQIESGNVLAEDLLPKLAEGLKNRTAGLAPIYERSLTAAQGRLGTSVQSLNVGIGEKLAPAIIPPLNAISGVVITLSENIDKLATAFKYLALGLAGQMLPGLVKLGQYLWTSASAAIGAANGTKMMTAALNGLKLAVKPLLLAFAAISAFEVLTFTFREKGSQQTLDAIKELDKAIAKLNPERNNEVITKVDFVSSGNGFLDWMDSVDRGMDNLLQKIPLIGGAFKFIQDLIPDFDFGGKTFDRQTEVANKLIAKSSFINNQSKQFGDASQLYGYIEALDEIDQKIATAQGRMTALRLTDAQGNAGQITALGKEIESLNNQRSQTQNNFDPIGLATRKRILDQMKEEKLTYEAQLSTLDQDKLPEKTKELERRIAELTGQIAISEQYINNMDTALKQLGNTLNAQRLSFINLSGAIAQTNQNYADSLNVQRTALTNSQVSRGLQSQVNQFEDLSFAVFEAEQNIKMLQQTMEAQKAYINSNVIDTSSRKTLEELAGKSLEDLQIGDVERIKLLVQNSDIKNVINDSMVGVLEQIATGNSQIIEAKKGLSENRKALAEFQITQEDYFRNTARQIYDLNRQTETQQIQDQRSIEDFAIQLRDTSRQLQLSNRSLIESYDDLTTDFNIQISTLEKGLLDAKDQLQLAELKTQSFSITPGNSNSAARQINSMVMQFTESLLSNRSSERQIKIDVLNLEKERIGRLRQIRGLEEQQVQAMIDYENQVRQTDRAFVDLNRSLTESANNLKRSFDELALTIDRTDNSSDAGKALSNALNSIPQYQHQYSVPQMQSSGVSGAVVYGIQPGTGQVMNRQSYTVTSDPIDPVPSDYTRNRPTTVSIPSPASYQQQVNQYTRAIQHPQGNLSPRNPDGSLRARSLSDIYGTSPQPQKQQFNPANYGPGDSNILTDYQNANLNGGMVNTRPLPVRPDPIQPVAKPQPQQQGFSLSQQQQLLLQAFQPVLRTISKAEGGFGSYNRGRAGDSRGKTLESYFGKPLSQITVNEIITKQNAGQLYAVGAYQMIPSTLKGAANRTGLGNAPFTPETQGLLAVDLMTNKRPEIGKFVRSQTEDLLTAITKGAMEWAGIGVPVNMKGHKRNVSRGQSYYSGIGGNAANVSGDAFGQSLMQSRQLYEQLKRNHGLQSKLNFDIPESIELGKTAQIATPQELKGLLGGAATGALLGAGAGAMFGGVGAIPGAFVGGITGATTGGLVGSFKPEWIDGIENAVKDAFTPKAKTEQAKTEPVANKVTTPQQTTPSVTNKAKAQEIKFKPSTAGQFNNPAFSTGDHLSTVNKELNVADVNLSGFPGAENVFERPPQLNTDPLKEQAGNITLLSAEIQRIKELTTDLTKQQSYAQLIDSVLGFNTQLGVTILNSNRALQDQARSIDQMKRSSKGYLTIWEKANQSGIDMYTSYENQIRSIEDKEREIGLLVAEQDKIKLDALLAIEQARKDGLPTDVIQAELDRTQGLLTDYATHQNILATQRQQLEATQGIAVANAQNRTYLQEQLGFIEKMVGLMGNISSARYDLGGTLVNESGIMQARMALDTVEEKAFLDGTNAGLAKGSPELANYIAMSKELAEVNYQKSFREAIPFVKELGDNLKEAIFQTGNFGEAFSKVLDVMASQIFDRLVLIPFTTKTSKLIGELFGMGQQAIPTLANAGLSMGQQSVNNPSISDDGSVIFEPFTASMDTAIQSSAQFSQGLTALASMTTTQVVTEQSALTQFITALQVATQSLYQFAMASGGGGQSSGGLFGTIVKGATSLFSGGDVSSLAGDFIPANVIGVDAASALPITDSVSIFADGLDQALTKETRRTGQQSMLAVINQGESVLSTLNGDAQKYQALKRSGQWDSISLADGTDKFYNQSRNYRGRWDNLVGTANRQQSQQTVNKFNQTYTIVTPNADSFRKSQSQIQDEGARTYRRKMR